MTIFEVEIYVLVYDTYTIHVQSGLKRYGYVG